MGNPIKGLGYIALAGLLGYLKRDARRTARKSYADWTRRKLLAPIQEETAFHAFGSGPLRAAAFAGAHLATEKHPDISSAVYRGLDTFVGGLIYGAASRELGVFGGIAAHIVHNIATDLE